MATPNPISGDTWEEMRPQIIQYYQEDEWPLKQVIKKLRTNEFNPNETQLRSKLKKWKVNKPNRKSHKKSARSSSASDSKILIRPARCAEEDNTSAVQTGSAQQPPHIFDPQIITPHPSVVTGLPSASMPTPSVWDPTPWLEDKFTFDQRSGLLRGNGCFNVDTAELNIPIPSPVCDTQSLIDSHPTPAPSQWDSSQAILRHGSASALQYGPATRPMAQNIEQPLNNSYPTRAQPCPTASQSFGPYLEPPQLQNWVGENFQDWRPPESFRSSSDASQGHRDSSRVEREARVRQRVSPANRKESSASSTGTQEQTSPYSGFGPSPISPQSSLSSQNPWSNVGSQQGPMSFGWTMNVTPGQDHQTHGEVSTSPQYNSQLQRGIDVPHVYEIDSPPMIPALLRSQPPLPEMNSYQLYDSRPQIARLGIIVPQHDLQPQPQPKQQYPHHMFR